MGCSPSEVPQTTPPIWQRFLGHRRERMVCCGRCQWKDTLSDGPDADLIPGPWPARPGRSVHAVRPETPRRPNDRTLLVVPACAHLQGAGPPRRARAAHRGARAGRPATTVVHDHLGGQAGPSRRGSAGPLGNPRSSVTLRCSSCSSPTSSPRPPRWRSPRSSWRSIASSSPGTSPTRCSRSAAVPRAA